MEPVALYWPSWPIRWVFSRNPLVRGVDRLEGVVVLLAAVVALLAIPVAGAVGTAVHDSRSQVYAQQAQSRQPLLATVTGAAISGDEADTAAAGVPGAARQTVTVPARWVVDGAEHRGLVKAAPTAVPGDHVEVWVDGEGQQVSKPIPPSRAGTEAVSAAIGVWFSVTAVVASVAILIRVALNRARDARWEHGIDNLQCSQG